MLSNFPRIPTLKPVLQISLTLAAIFFLTNATTAQTMNESNSSASSDSTAHKFEIGVATGLSLNQFTKGQPNTSQNTGYTAGLSINYKLIHGISLQLETNFLQQGGRTVTFKDDTRLGLPESFDTKNTKNSSYAINSIEIPLLINYTFNIKQTWKPSLYAGASYAYAYNVTEDYQKTGNLLPGEDIIATVIDTRNATSEFNTSRVNFIAGANVKLPLTSKLLLLIDMRYLNGLSPARENYSYMEKIGFGSDLRTNSFVTKIGIILPL